MIILGIDPGTKTTGLAVVHFDEGTARILAHRCSSPPYPMPVKFSIMIVCEDIEELLRGEYEAEVVVCEDFEVEPFRGRIKGGKEMAELLRKIQEVVEQAGVKFVRQSPQEKRAFTDKEIMLLLPDKDKRITQHECDACKHALVYEGKLRVGGIND